MLGVCASVINECVLLCVGSCDKSFLFCALSSSMLTAAAMCRSTDYCIAQCNDIHAPQRPSNARERERESARTHTQFSPFTLYWAGVLNLVFFYWQSAKQRALLQHLPLACRCAKATFYFKAKPKKSASPKHWRDKCKAQSHSLTLTMQLDWS